MKRLLSSTVLVLIAYSALLAQTYPIAWTNPINTTVNADNSLTKTGTIDVWDSGIASQNVITSGNDGYIQFTYPATATVNRYMVSLSRLNNDLSHPGDYCFGINNGVLVIYNASSLLGQFGALVANDVLKISREGNTVNFYKNGTVLRTVALTANTDFLRVDVAISRGSVPVIIGSFKPMLSINPQFTFPSLANNDGGISVQVEGQYNPVTYSWTGGETTPSITGKPRANSYSATVTDAQGRTVTRSYGVGYPIAWTNLVGVSINADNSLTKTDAVGWTAGASSLNVLPANTDGWVEFVVNEPSSTYMIGFSRIDKDSRYVLIDYRFSVDVNGSIALFDPNVGNISLGSIMKGDVFRISREGANIKYYFNGIVKRTIAASAAMNLVVDLSIYDKYGPLPVVSASFDKQIRVLSALTLPNSNSNAGGSIALNVQGAYPPSTITWSGGGETGNLITNKSRGKYTVTVTDGASRTFTRSYQLGYPVSWTDLQGTGVKPDNTVYVVSGSWCSAVSSNLLLPSTDGWMEFTLPNPNYTMMVGLARTNALSNSQSIDYAFYFQSGDVLMDELGGHKGPITSQAEGDVFTIAREGSNIKYYINGVVVRTVATNPAYQLIVDCSLFNGSLPMVTTSFSRTAQTYYSRASGAWTTPSTWSLTEGGAACAQYPGNEDTAVVKGYAVTVKSGIYAAAVNIIANNDATSVTVDGANTSLTVKGNVTLHGENNAATDKALVVQNNASISVQP